MRLALSETARDGGVATLAATLPPSDTDVELRYRTRTGALLRVDRVVAGAYDREHHAVLLGPSAQERALELVVELRSLATNGLPAGDGVKWRWLLSQATQEPSAHLDVETYPQSGHARAASAQLGVPLWGHSHLDVAWLWTYDEARRKAQRTFANAIALLRRDERFIFMQSQPQLYAWVQADTPDLFAEVRDAVAANRWDPSVAAMWVEPDCNLPSGESLLRQMLFAHRYCMQTFDVEPTIAWLPDTFGFPNTLPTLLAHAGIACFATTKLAWNDTSAFPYAQFHWIGPDGASVLAAQIAGMDGALTSARAQKAKERGEPVVVGYGDGGGGPTIDDVATARELGHFEHPSAFFDRLKNAALPDWPNELYLQYHRGTYTTHHDVKAENAWCERALSEVEEALAWALAVRAQPEVLQRLRAIVDKAWEIVLRNQFHDVLPGTAVRDAFVDALAEYAQLREGIELVRKSLHAILPRGAATHERSARIEPHRDADEWVFAHGGIEARLNDSGALLSLRGHGGPNVVSQANLLALYADRPKKWDAWNIDSGYAKRRLTLRPGEAHVEDGALQVPFQASKSSLVMRVWMERDALLRVALDGEWNEEHALLRVEEWLPLSAGAVRYGSPHGHIDRAPSIPEQFEVPGQRYACVADASAAFAMLVNDTYGWSARTLSGGGTALGHSLLRAPTWPDPLADRGPVHLEWAYAPLDSARPSFLEALWESYALAPRVRLFRSDVPSVRVVAVKPADDGDGIIVRVRECDGDRAQVALRCGARMRSVSSVDGVEREIDGDARIEGESILGSIVPFGLRSYRVRFV